MDSCSTLLHIHTRMHIVCVCLCSRIKVGHQLVKTFAVNIYIGQLPMRSTEATVATPEQNNAYTCTYVYTCIRTFVCVFAYLHTYENIAFSYIIICCSAIFGINCTKHTHTNKHMYVHSVHSPLGVRVRVCVYACVRVCVYSLMILLLLILTFPLRRFSRDSYHIAPFMRHFATGLNASIFNNGTQQKCEQEQLCACL